MQRIINGAVNKAVFLLFFLSFFIPSGSGANGNDIIKCKSLDTREFGLINDGNIGEPWSEAQIIDKYGQPCQIINMGEVFVTKSHVKIIELDAKTGAQGKTTSGEIAVKKQFVYKGDYSNKATIITIVGGVVVKTERID
ncbi:MAG: hypothetical protein HY886_06415 [Deltaproteobacteria bacterium]|nr:hypothetical protein [Deltaproteobacteria bacterium]